MDSEKEQEEALRSIADMTARSEKAQAKFAQGTAQHTLQTNRIHALNVAAALISRESAGCADAGEYTKEDLASARAPIDSLIGKSEKARQKMSPDTWQHRMLSRNLSALDRASSLLARALETD